jgi:hypothetical protein
MNSLLKSKMMILKTREGFNRYNSIQHISLDLTLRFIKTKSRNYWIFVQFEFNNDMNKDNLEFWERKASEMGQL